MFEFGFRLLEWHRNEADAPCSLEYPTQHAVRAFDRLKWSENPYTTIRAAIPPFYVCNLKLKKKN